MDTTVAFESQSIGQIFGNATLFVVGNPIIILNGMTGMHLAISPPIIRKI